MSNSLVISSYFYGHLGGHAIESALAQTKPFDEIYFVDDCAGDCRNLTNIYPEVHFILRDNNLGVVKNFQDMLNRVTGERVMFLGADNWLHPKTLETLSAVDADVVTYDIMVVGERSNEILGRHPTEVTKTGEGYYWDRSAGHHGSMLYNAQMARDVGGYLYDQRGRSVEDMVLYHRLLDAGATRQHVSEALLYYRRHRENFNPC